MSHPDSDTPSSATATPQPAPSVALAPAPAAQHPPAPRSGGLWLAVLALLLAVGALVVAGMLWQRLGFTQEELARRSQESATQVGEARALAGQAEALTHELKARLSVAEVKLSEVSLQRSQLEELMLSVSRSRDDNLVQDIDSALRLALQQTQLTGSAQPLLSALQAADQRIGRAAQPRLNPVQRAIARDIERIQGASLTDVPSLVRRLDELTRQADLWPMLNQPASLAEVRTGQADAPPAEAAVDGASAEVLPAVEPAEEPLAAPGWARVAQTWNRFWMRVRTALTQNGRELVRVSRIDQPEAALLAPEQAFFLRENIKLRLLNARLGLLARQTDAAQADLATTSKALEHYFEVDDPSVTAALVTLAQLSTELSASELPRPDESLAALATAAGGR
jgi:uroporphyrin-III C-methyltransferase